MSPAAVTVLFARAPRPGRVKSRLAASVGPVAAARLHAAMAADTWATLGTLGVPRRLATDADAGPWLAPVARQLRQPAAGGFGERLAAALAPLAAEGVGAALVLGADMPHLAPETLRTALARLADHALVTSPAADGGVVLMGFRLPLGFAVRELPWGTARLGAALVDAARRAGQPVATLEPGSFDIDDLRDVERLLDAPPTVRARCPRTIAEAAALLGRSAAPEAGPTPILAKRRLRVLQLHVGDRCDLRCAHCHASSGPEGRVAAPRSLFETALAVLDRHPSFEVVDVTGGSPELVPDVPWFLEQLVGRGRRVLFRTNLTALEGAAGERIIPLLERLAAEVIASLPGVTAEEVDAQRGRGTFQRAIRMLRRLNERGFGAGGPGRLALAVNPVGDAPPAPQATLEARFHEALARDHGVRFDALYALANMPLGRFRERLEHAGTLGDYEADLRARHDPATIARVMCRETLAVDAEGRLYDCEFNRAAQLPLRSPRLFRLADLLDHDWRDTPVAWGRHCCACTAGAGSS